MAGSEANSTTQMDFQVAEGGEAVVIVTLSGELDITNVERLASAVRPLIEAGARRLLVELGDLRFADSSAIALWVKWAGSVDEIELRNPSPVLRRVLETMGLTEFLNLRPSVTR
jgi:anti-anti-sigma factor